MRAFSPISGHTQPAHGSSSVGRGLDDPGKRSQRAIRAQWWPRGAKREQSVHEGGAALCARPDGLPFGRTKGQVSSALPLGHHPRGRGPSLRRRAPLSSIEPGGGSTTAQVDDSECTSSSASASPDFAITCGQAAPSRREAAARSDQEATPGKFRWLKPRGSAARRSRATLATRTSAAGSRPRSARPCGARSLGTSWATVFRTPAPAIFLRDPGLARVKEA